MNRPILTFRAQIFILTTAALFIVNLTCPAQGRVSLSGRILDQNGAGVSEVTVSLRQSEVGFAQSVRSDAEGRYRFDGLLPGDYQLLASGRKFSVTAQDVRVVAAGLTVDLKLRPGTLTENVTVASSEIAGTVEEQQRIPGSVEIITRQALELARPFTFNEVLRKAPGVYVRDEEGFGLRPSIGLRGLDPNRSAKVLLMEDGVPLGHAPYGDSDAYYHPPVERYGGVEILKGASQIAYGPQTIGGAINYLTPAPPADGLHGSVLLTGGNLSYFNGHASVGGRFGRTGYLFDFMRKQGEGARENIRAGLYDVNAKVVSRLNESQSL